MVESRKLFLYTGQGYVKLLGVIPAEIPEGFSSRDYYIANAARYSTNTQISSDGSVYNFLERLFKWGHFSPFEQARLSFEVKAPMVVFWQMDRHRTFQYSSHLRRSGRYTEFSEEDFYIPEYFENYEGVREGYTAKQSLKKIIDMSMDGYRYCMSKGLKKESARFLLPAWCMLYTEIMSVDLKNLMHFLALRLDKAAQLEIRELATAMFDLTEEVFPHTMDIFASNVTTVNYFLGEE